MSADPPYFSTKVVSTRRFWIPQDALDPRLGVLSGGFEQVAADYRIERDGFPQPLIELIAGGEGELILGGRVHRLVPGAIFAYGPGTPVCMTTDPRNVLRKYFLAIAGREVGALLATAHLAPGAVARVADPLPIIDIVEQAIRWGQGNAAHRARACATVVEYLCLRLAHDAVPADDAGGEALATFRRCHQAIEQRFHEVRTQAAAAALCGVEPSYLCRLYRRYAQESPYQHLRRLRLHHALSRLQAGETVAAVAGAAGFSDPAHFSRAFAQVFGLPPSRVKGGRIGA